MTRQGGLSLIELLAAMTIGLMLLSGLISIFTGFTRANTDMLKTVRLQQELRAIMNLMINDIRRAGYWSQAAAAWENNAPNGFSEIRIVGGNCILYAYDRQRDDADGQPGRKDYGGFKLDGDRIRIRTSATPCQGASCGDCGAGVWWTLNDDNTVRITQLRFRQISSTIPAMQAGARLQLRRMEIVLGGVLAQEPSVTHMLRDAVYIPNAAILPAPQ